MTTAEHDPNYVVPETDLDTPDPDLYDAAEGRKAESGSGKESEPSSEESADQTGGEESPGESEESHLDPGLVREAAAMGFTEDDLSSFTNESLTSVLAAIDRRALEMLAPMQGGPQQGMPQVGQESATPQSPPAAPAPQDLKPFEIKLDPEEWGDSELMKNLQGMNEHYASQVAQLNSALQQQQELIYNQMQYVQQQQAEQYSAWFDSKISELGDDFEPVFGKGNVNSIRQGSDHWNARAKLDETFARLSDAFPHAGRDELFARAVRMEFGQVQTKLQREKLSAQLKDRSKKTIGRPGRKASKVDQEIDPESGFSRSVIDEVQQQIDAMRG